MSTADLVVFDCDGVLVDSEPISVRVGTAILAELGWTLTEHDFAERFVGCSSEHFRREVSAGLGRPVDVDWEDRFSGRYHEAFEQELQPVPGVAGVLDALDAEGMAYCVASNSSHDHVERVLSLTGIGHRFAGRVFSAEDVRSGKPSPEVFLHAAGSLGADPQRTVVVEDSVYGVRAARAAGMRCLGYAGGLTPAAHLAHEGAEVFHTMDELSPLLVCGQSRAVASTPGAAR
jgi:HAD superfamily hydrolase (TIGR01509 family)